MSVPSVGASASSTGRRMTDPDPRPRPKYGEYGPVMPPAPVVEPVAAVAPTVPNRTRDVVVTAVLLLVGVYDVVTGFPAFATLGAILAQAYEIQGIPGFASRALADQVGIGFNIGKSVLLVATIVVSLVFIAQHRRAFWVPLVAGVVAALAVMVFVLAVLLQDPSLLAWAQTHSP